MIQDLKVNGDQTNGVHHINFRDLALVNYLVGESGSGKSSVLSYIFSQDVQRSCFLKDSLFIEEIDSHTLTFEAFAERNWLILDLLPPMLAVCDKECKETLALFKELGFWDSQSYAEYDSVSAKTVPTGKRKMYNFVFALVYHLMRNGNTDLCLVEEPENHLHPNFQKQIPSILEYLAKKYQVQFLVTTNSPFVISSVAKWTDSQEDNRFPNQKVYFLKDGHIADKHGVINPKGETGYWGRKLTFIANKLLGSGLVDLITPQDAVLTKDAPRIVLCEGEGKDQDARVYNIIFSERKPRTVFVSCKGSSQLYRSFQLLQEIKPGLSANTVITMIRDRDHEFPTYQLLHEFESMNPGCHILHRRAIECYIYTSEVAQLFLSKHGKELTNSHRQELDRIQRDIQYEVEHAIAHSNYKTELEEAFLKAVGSEVRFLVDKRDIMEYLAHLITPQTDTYHYLEKDIFRY